MGEESKGCCNIPMAVFVETNFATRLAVPASPDITVEDFKREVEKMHLNCFPEFGNIAVNALMVKKRLHYYHLSPSLPLNYAFPGLNATPLLQTSVSLSNTGNHVEPSKHDEAQFHTPNSTAAISKFSRKKVNLQIFPNRLKFFALSCFGRGKKNARRKWANAKRKREVNGSRKAETDVVEEGCETNSEPASVSGIIKKYFSDYDEVASRPAFFSNMESPVKGRIRPRVVWPEKAGSGNKKPEVGKRLLLASDSLGLSPTNQRSMLSTCRNLVFDMNRGGSKINS